MTRIYIPIITIAVFALLLFALAFGLFGSWQPHSVNPFSEYSRYMPGQKLPDLKGCDVWDEYPQGMVYAWCYLNGGAFRAIGIRGTWDGIQGTYFYPRDLRMGEMVGWYGEASKTRKLKRWGQWTFDWGNMTAFARDGRGRFEAHVFLVSYR